MHESEPNQEVLDLTQLFVPHSVACPRSSSLGVNRVNVDSDDETGVLICFQKFNDKDMWQLFAEQTNIYTNQSFSSTS